MKQTIIFINRAAPKSDQVQRYFRGDKLTIAQVEEMGISTKELTPTLTAGYTFRVRTNGKTHKGRVTTQGDLVVYLEEK